MLIFDRNCKNNGCNYVATLLTEHVILFGNIRGIVVQ